MGSASFYTIGHSTHAIEEFVEMLQRAGATMVVDVRTVPRSRTNPQYNKDLLPQTLSPSDIGYEHIAALGGLRGRDRAVPREVNAFWQNESFHNYADYAMGENFRAGLAQLSELGRNRRCAIMCAEALWWRCHRRIVADYLLAAGSEVLHVMGPGKLEPARLTAAARIVSPGVLAYAAAS